MGVSEEVFEQELMSPPRLCMEGGAPILHIPNPPEEVLPPLGLFLVPCLVTMATVARGSHGC